MSKIGIRLQPRRPVPIAEIDPGLRPDDDVARSIFFGEATSRARNNAVAKNDFSEAAARCEPAIGFFVVDIFEPFDKPDLYSARQVS